MPPLAASMHVEIACVFEPTTPGGAGAGGRDGSGGRGGAGAEGGAEGASSMTGSSSALPHSTHPLPRHSEHNATEPTL